MLIKAENGALFISSLWLFILELSQLKFFLSRPLFTTVCERRGCKVYIRIFFIRQTRRAEGNDEKSAHFQHETGFRKSEIALTLVVNKPKTSVDSITKASIFMSKQLLSRKTFKFCWKTRFSPFLATCDASALYFTHFYVFQDILND